MVEDGKVVGVELEDGRIFNSKCVILTTGTYMKADILVGDTRRREGPHGENLVTNLSENLEELGFQIKD